MRCRSAKAGTGAPHQGPALYAGVKASGQARWHRLAAAQPSRNFGRRDLQADRHHAQHHQAIRERSHWNISEIQPKDPVTLGLCSQRELDAIVARAAKKAGLADKAADDSRFAGDKEACSNNCAPNATKPSAPPKKHCMAKKKRLPN
jgi:hypothetical protein